ncbi:hypothetical protein A6V39_00920 [Candidatus Mycoplasma haematobovis]|uniref:Uncharacterized protein n=1 Tax=Candidatus Mycoplasma haematobovis TaxID=432608 RepID=A0A1A9QEQ3_9MOLU|nr:hypothetical protein [Candidatus Mycoplasma haematobovis]OAL10614.1 hypothetical protein A6V39_00920 [Candidatus Mycoplasma haematobovis]
MKGLLASNFSFETLKNSAKKAIAKYIQDLEADVNEERKRPSKKPSAKAEFLGIIAAEKAYQRSKEAKIETLTEKFIEALTMPCTDNNCDADGLVDALSNKK